MATTVKALAHLQCSVCRKLLPIPGEGNVGILVTTGGRVLCDDDAKNAPLAIEITSLLEVVAREAIGR